MAPVPFAPTFSRRRFLSSLGLDTGIFGDLKSRARQSLVLWEFGVTHPLPECISARRDSTRLGMTSMHGKYASDLSHNLPFLAQRVCRVR